MFHEFQILAGEDSTLDDYIAFHLMNFFKGILVPMVLALYSYFGRNKLQSPGYIRLFSQGLF